MKSFIIIALIFFLLPGCALIKKDRAIKHNGLSRSDFNLPLIFYPASNNESRSLVIFLSGDGGWLEFEDKLSLKFAEEGNQTIGFNSRSYFWDRKTPGKTATDLTRLIGKYARIYHAKTIILCGYSFGADVVPFIFNRMPPRLRSKIQALVMMSPFSTTDFKVHTSDLLNIAADNRPFKVIEEVNKVNIPIFCFYGAEEDLKSLAELDKKNFTLKLVPGSHQYIDSAYIDILKSINLAKQLR
jgi:type IV secretory pathway VirJ component